MLYNEQIIETPEELFILKLVSLFEWIAGGFNSKDSGGFSHPIYIYIYIYS